MSFDFNILIPLAMVLFSGFLIARVISKNKLEEKKIESRQISGSALTPLRLQAYERMTLYLERISPNYLLLRVYDNSLKVIDFQQLLQKEIREEYHHNLAQQVYLSEDLWEEIKQAMNEMLAMVNQSAGELKPDEPAINLSKRIFDKVIIDGNNPTSVALSKLKKEVHQLFD